MHTVEPGDPETHSKDLVAENLEQLRKIFPSAFAEGKVDFDALRELLGDAIEPGDERFGLTWFGKRNARRVALKPSTATLLPRPDESVDWNATRNIMVEGDNLEILKLLQKSYAGKVKLIYIDPPYNTGNSDFIYPDTFQDSIRNYLELTGQINSSGGRLSSNAEVVGRRHSAWLDMMYPRLMLARNLLRQDGVICISIDDGEQAHLRSMCDEIFGEENFVANIMWQKRYVSNVTAKWFSDMHDFVMVYARDRGCVRISDWERNEDQLEAYKNPDNDPRGPWRAQDLSASKPYAAGLFEITGPTGKKFNPPANRYWRCNQEKFDSWNSDGRIWWGKDRDARPMLKAFLQESERGIKPHTWWDYGFAGHNKEATLELKRLFGGDAPFDTPKPVKLVRRIIDAFCNDGDLVLDFFAGSGVTGHAVMDWQADNSAALRFILAQLPEKTGRSDYPTISDITRERLRRASQEIQKRPSDGEFSGDFGFRSFVLSDGNIVRWDTSRPDFEQQAFEHIDNVREGRSEQDVLFELLLSQGLDLASAADARTFAGIHVFATGRGLLFACLPSAGSITKGNAEEIAEGIVTWRGELQPEADVTVFLKDVAFADDVAKANLVAILEQHESPFVVKSL
ncbi:site-specific DNA-methyltransferase [Streptomyces celluloflavus]|uniref:site-specific DNA-methyltransferase n=1 Tax=Streptomyces celluloflavus TaxID=58344 RepID=UPI0036C0C566